MKRNTYLLIGVLTIALFSSCGSDDDYVSKTDRVLCDCFRKKSSKRGIDYDYELKKDLEAYQKRYPSFKSLDKESILALIEKFASGKFDERRDAAKPYERYRSQLDYRILRKCVKWDAKYNDESQELYDELDKHGFSHRASETEWKAQCVDAREFVLKFEDAQMMDHIYMKIAWLMDEYHHAMLEEEKERMDELRSRLDEIDREETEAPLGTQYMVTPPPRPEVIEVMEPEPDTEVK